MAADTYGLAADLATAAPSPSTNRRPSSGHGAQGAGPSGHASTAQPVVPSSAGSAAFGAGGGTTPRDELHAVSHAPPGTQTAHREEHMQPTAVHVGHAAGAGQGGYGLDSEFGAAAPVGGYGLDAQLGGPPAPSTPVPPLSPQSRPLTASRASGTPGLTSSSWRRAKKAVDSMGFIKRVGQLAANARASTLRELEMNPAHSYAAAMLPAVREDGAGLADCVASHAAAAGAAPDVQHVHVPTMTMTFLRALDVPSAGMTRGVSRVLLRACVFANGKPVGNVAVVPGRQTTDAQGVPTWKFGETMAKSEPYHLLVRSAERARQVTATGDGMADAQRMWIYLELNVVPFASAEEEVGAGSFDPAARRRLRQVDEVCVAWGQCPWPHEFSAGSTTLDLTLMGAGVEAPMSLLPSRIASTRANSMWRRLTTKGKLLARGPTLSVKLAMLSFRQAELVNKLPVEIVCSAALVPILATYREFAAAEANSLSGQLYANSCNPTLRILPALLSDQTITEELIQVWRRVTAHWTEARGKDPRKRQEALEGLVLKFWPLLHSNAVPEMPVQGNITSAMQRARVIKGYTSSHPVEALSRSPDEWLHRPFDIRELAHNFGDPVAVYA